MALANIYEYMLSSSEDEDFMEIILQKKTYFMLIN